MLLSLLSSLLLFHPAQAGSPSGAYTIANRRADGYDKITSRFYINPNSTWAEGYYAANQVDFQFHDVQYFGLQPRSGIFATATGHVTYSVFGNGSSIGDPNRCFQGADGDAGVSCSLEIDLNKGEWYTIESAVVETGALGRRWNGTLIDGYGRRTYIASFWTDDTYGQLKGTGMQWLEWYKFNGDDRPAAQRPCQPPFTVKQDLPTLYAAGVKTQATDSGYRSGRTIEDKCAVAANDPNYSIAYGPTQIQITGGIHYK